jgi:hydroxymethylbilane synthase
MAARPLRLGTRGSALARRQSELVAGALRQLGHGVDLITVVTEGDVRPPESAWGEGAFVGALERALLAGDVDLAVHSAKDVPIEGRGAARGGLVIAAYPPRDDPRDALVTRDGADMAALPDGARVGTDSPRRAAFLRAVRPDLRIVPLHGNVDTRLRRLAAGEVDALILAIAGLTRLGHSARADQPLDPSLVPPAPGQGALAVQCRLDDGELRAVLARLDDPATRRCVEAEREVLRFTGGGCRAPLGALAALRGDWLELLAGAVPPSGVPIVLRRVGAAADWATLAGSLAQELLAAGFRAAVGGPAGAA